MKKLGIKLLVVAFFYGLVATASALNATEAQANQPQAPSVIFPIEATSIGQFNWSDTWGAPRSGGRSHLGVDILGPKGAPVVAVESGTISFSTFDNGDGNWIQLTGDSGWRYRYIHLNNDTPGTDDGNARCNQAFSQRLCNAIPAGSNRISTSTRVEAGEIIGFNGDSGNAESTAPHLHFEVAFPSSDGGFTSINPTPVVDGALLERSASTARATDVADLNSTTATVTRLYTAFFNRLPDKDGLEFWIGEAERGIKLDEIAYNFEAGNEFGILFKNASDAQYVEFLYGQVLKRGSDAAGKAYWVDQLEQGTVTRATIVIFFAEGEELRTILRSRTEAVTAYSLTEDRVPNRAELQTWTELRRTKTVTQTLETVFG